MYFYVTKMEKELAVLSRTKGDHQYFYKVKPTLSSRFPNWLPYRWIVTNFLVNAVDGRGNKEEMDYSLNTTFSTIVSGSFMQDTRKLYHEILLLQVFSSLTNFFSQAS